MAVRSAAGRKPRGRAGHVKEPVATRLVMAFSVVVGVKGGGEIRVAVVEVDGRTAPKNGRRGPARDVATWPAPPPRWHPEALIDDAVTSK
jgi:hypothetical protein